MKKEGGGEGEGWLVLVIYDEWIRGGCKKGGFVVEWG